MSNQSKTNPDNDHFSFVDAEHNVLNFWQENQIFEKSLEQTANQDPYIFYDGPPLPLACRTMVIWLGQS